MFNSKEERAKIELANQETVTQEIIPLIVEALSVDRELHFHNLVMGICENRDYKPAEVIRALSRMRWQGKIGCNGVMRSLKVEDKS